MKVLVVALALVAIVAAEWTPKTADEIKAARSQCLEANPLSPETLQKMRAFETPDEEPVRKFVLCVAKKLKFFCEMEGFHPDRIAKQFEKALGASEALAIAEKCADKNEQKSSADVWAYRGHECLLKSKIGDFIKEAVKKEQGAN